MATSISEDKVRIVWGAVGLLGFGYYVWEAFNMPDASPGDPGPSFFPMVVGSAGIVISAIVVIDALVKRHQAGQIDLPERRVAIQIIMFSAALVAFAVLLPILGQYVASILFCVTCVKIIGNVSLIKATLFGLAIAVFVSWLFIDVFSIPLPRGYFF